MYHKTRGIVLNTIKHSETSIVAHILTEKFGRRTYIVNGVRGKKSKMNYFQALSVLDMEVSERSNKGLQRIKEMKFVNTYSNIRFDYVKNYISFFLAEVLYRTLIYDVQDSSIFQYLLASIDYLDAKEDNYYNFHLFFILELTQYLGFYPRNNSSEVKRYFEMEHGEFSNFKSNTCLDEKNSFYLSKMIDSNLLEIEQIKMSGKERSEFLDAFLNYYSLHNHSLNNLNSLKVLKECF
jgi:DNA repair protein RecO (recombination protein O)